MEVQHPTLTRNLPSLVAGLPTIKNRTFGDEKEVNFKSVNTFFFIVLTTTTALEQDANRGPCTLINLVDRTLPKSAQTNLSQQKNNKAHPIIGTNSNSSSCPFFSKGKITETNKTTTTLLPSQELPKGHQNVVGDISACPFFGGASSNKVTTDSSKDAEEEGEKTVVAKGKCPIPFHNQLVSPKFWLCVFVMVLAVLIAKRTM